MAKTFQPRDQEKVVLNPEETGVVESSIPGSPADENPTEIKTRKAKQLKSRMRIAPDVSVDTLEGRQVGGVPLAGGMASRSVAGASNWSVADDNSRIPYTSGNYRPETRHGKKRSDDLFEMDNTVSEQIEVLVDDSKDLKESPESLQGYNGRKQFKQTRAKKNFAYTLGNSVKKVPQQLLNEASVDFQRTSKVVYTSGQMISDSIPDKANYPRVSETIEGVTMPQHRKSNYRQKSFKFTIQDGMITNPKFVEECYNVHADPIAKDQSNFNYQIDQNNVASAMLKMQTELGRETSDRWSPLAYVIDQPYEFNMLAHDIEASTGAVMAAAYRSAVSSLAFQRNILGKDGVNPQYNAIKMILEGYAGRLANSKSTSMNSTDFGKMIFNQAEYRKGSPAAIIEMFDSTKKYRTKADILGGQRSFGLHLATASNNISNLCAKPEFIKSMNKAHMFSTVTGEYNPLLPIHVTDEISLITPLSMNIFLNNWVHPKKIDQYIDDVTNDVKVKEKLRERYDYETGTFSQYVYGYRDIRNKYYTRVQHPVVEGLMAWLLKHEGAVARTFGEGEVTIPITYNMTAPSLWSFILCSASEWVTYHRNNTMRDILFAGDQMTYIWDDLKTLKELDPLKSTQLIIGKFNEPLKLGKLAPDTLVREFWAEHFQLMDKNNDSTTYFAPWYFNEQAFSGSSGEYTSGKGFFNESTAFNMSMPSIRDGVRHEYVDFIKSMEERDIRLSLDKLTTLPIFTNRSVKQCGTVEIVEHTPITTSSTLTGKINIASLRYDINSDGRIIVNYDCATGTNTDLTDASIMCTPRELGWICDDISGRNIVTNVADVSTGSATTALNITTIYLNPNDTKGATNSCSAYNGYTPVYLESYRVQADSGENGSIDRGMALSQIFYRFFASCKATTVNDEFILNTGIVPCISYKDGSPLALNCVFNLGSENASNKVLSTEVKSISGRIWTTLQRFFLPLNRFENSYLSSGSNAAYDPLETAFYFGCCGTLASDFTQDILERLDAYDQLGLGYTEDVFISASPIFR